MFFAAVACLAAALSIHDSVFNNFLDDAFKIGAGARGRLEFPRELPGLLVVLLAGVLCTLAVTHLGVVGCVVFSAGMVGMALFGSRYGTMIAMMMLGSAGHHLLQPVQSSIAIGLSDGGSRGKRIGQMGALGNIGALLGAGTVWLFADDVAPRYRMWFLGAAAAGTVAAMLYAGMHVPHLHQPRARLVFRRRYRLYYALELLFGARKQIFITFGPWVLIRVYGEAASGIAGLLMAGAIIGIVFKPISGWAIDRFGEGTVLVADGLVLAVVCIGYGYARTLSGDPSTALVIARGCFVTDNLLFALGAGRAVYLSRLTHSPQELTSSLAMGISINHIVSMIVPAIAGAVWVGFGYERVFAAAAVLAIAIAVVATRVPRRNALQASRQP